MPLNLHVTLRDALDHFSQQQLLQMTPAGFTAAGGLPQQAPRVTLDPPEDQKPHLRRTITWHLNAMIMVSDDASNLGALRQTVNTLVTGIAGVAGVAASAIPNPQTALRYIFDTLENLEDIWDKTQVDKLFSVSGLPVVFEERGDRQLELTTKVSVNAIWLCNDPGDDGNAAWIELEQHQIDSLPVHIAQPESWSPLTGAPPGRNRIARRLGSGTNRVGPLAGTIEDCHVTLDRDRSIVNLDVTASAIADDTVAVLIRSITLELSIEEKVDDRRREKEKPPKKPEGKPGKPKPGKKTD